jgi:acetyl esterase/lipase
MPTQRTESQVIKSPSKRSLNPFPAFSFLAPSFSYTSSSLKIKANTLQSRANPTKYSFLYGARPAQNFSRKTDHTIPVPAGGSIRIRVYESQSSLDKHNRPCYINFHGGGWVFGGFETDKRFCFRVCNVVGCVVVDVDYRLAPEFPWPAQLQDSWAALLWVYSLCHPSFLDYNSSSDLINGIQSIYVAVAFPGY